MKRKWMIAGAVALAVAGALPWGVGVLTEYQWQQAVTEVNDSQPFLQLETERYERGILGAQVHLAVVLSVPERKESVRVNFRGDVTHGMTGSLMVLEPESGWEPEHRDWFPEQPPHLTLESRIWGSALLKLKIPETRIVNDATGERLTTASGEAWIRVQGMDSEVEMFMTLPLVEAADPQLNISMSGIEVKQKVEQLLGDLWTGNGTLSIGRFELQSKDGPPIALSRLSMSTSSSVNDDKTRLDSGFVLTLEQVIVPGGSYGPHHIELAMNGVAVESANRLSAALTDLQSLDMAGEGNRDVAAEIRAMEAAALAMKDAALSGFKLTIPRVSLATPQGEIRATAEVHHPQLSAEERQGTLLVMPRLTGKLDLSLPVALVESDPVLKVKLAPLIHQGMLVQASDRLKVEAQLQDMVLTVNGQELPLPPVL